MLHFSSHHKARYQAYIRSSRVGVNVFYRADSGLSLSIIHQRQWQPEIKILVVHVFTGFAGKFDDRFIAAETARFKCILLDVGLLVAHGGPATTVSV